MRPLAKGILLQMPPYVPVGYGGFSHRLLLDGDPEPMFITGHWKASSDIQSAALLATIAGGMQTAFRNFHTARGLLSYKATGTLATYNAGSGILTAEALDSTYGGSNQPGVPQNTAFLIHKGTGFSGRRQKGRFYYPGVAEIDVSQTGVINGATVTAFNGSLSTYLNAFNGVANVDFMVLAHGATAPGVGTAPTELTTLTCDPIVATQRRRLRR